MTDIRYKRLTRARPRRTQGGIAVVMSRSSLWLGPDHLLCIDSNGYTEEYKRFYFRDIQAFTIRRTARRAIIGTTLGVFAVLFATGLAYNLGDPDDIGFVWFFGVLFTLFGALFLYNIFASPTVRCYLQTAVQTEELPPLNRLRRAHRVIARLEPLINEAQGFLPREELIERLRSAQSAEAAYAPPPLEPPPVQP